MILKVIKMMMMMMMMMTVKHLVMNFSKIGPFTLLWYDLSSVVGNHLTDTTNETMTL